MTILTLVSGQLLEAGFRRLQATSLKRKHVEALLERWLAERLSPGTIKNRMAALRWWAQKVGNAGAIPADNASLGIPDRRFVTNDNKAQQVEEAGPHHRSARPHESDAAAGIRSAAKRMHPVPTALRRPGRLHA
jgi:hypothetical protein